MIANIDNQRVQFINPGQKKIRFGHLPLLIRRFFVELFALAGDGFNFLTAVRRFGSQRFNTFLNKLKFPFIEFFGIAYAGAGFA